MKKLMMIVLFWVTLLNVYAQEAPKIKVYFLQGCGRCSYTIKYLQDHNIPFNKCNMEMPKCGEEMWTKLFKDKVVKEGESVSAPVIKVGKKIYANIDNLEGFLDKLNDDGEDKEILQHKTSIITLEESPKVKTEEKPVNVSALPSYYHDTPKEWTKEQKDLAFDGANTSGLSEEESKLIYLMNLARTDGALFVKTHVIPYVSPTNKKPDVLSLIADLNKTKGLKLFKASNSLHLTASIHAKDMGKTGQVGHNSSNGTDCFDRIAKYNKGGAMAENCSYGWENALDILMQLLIDEGVSSKGHRKNILNNSYTYVGVAIEPHKNYRFNCVQDFSDTE